MKKIMLRILPIMLIFSILNCVTSNAKENTGSLGQNFNSEKFIEFVERNEGFRVTDSGIEVQETKENDKNEIKIIDRRNPDSISIISSKKLIDTPNFKLRFNPLTWLAEEIIEVFEELVVDGTIQWVCNGLSKEHGIEDYCGYVLNQAIAGLIPSGKYKVSKYFYKDPNCVPPHSYMCNSAPYAYYKYEMIKI